jgi:shikimate kinase
MPESHSEGLAEKLLVQNVATGAWAGPICVQRIVLTGFMGAGKTTVGNLLSDRLAWRFVDVDAHIEAAAGKTIAQLFVEQGEPWFRQLEHETIRDLLAAESTVLALGGGAIEDQRTLALLLASPQTRLIHLEASLPTILERCRGTENQRPILQDAVNLENRYQRRLPLYRQAHYTLAVDSLPPATTTEAILHHLGMDRPGTDDLEMGGPQVSSAV